MTTGTIMITMTTRMVSTATILRTNMTMPTNMGRVIIITTMTM
jgi:hypothetical protein